MTKLIKLFFVLATLCMFCVLVGKELTREGLWLWKLSFMMIEWIGGANFLAIIMLFIGSSPIWSVALLMYWLWKQTYKQEDYRG